MRSARRRDAKAYCAIEQSNVLPGKLVLAILVGGALAVSSAPLPAMGAVVADLVDDFQAPSPANGWGYYWNSTGPIGDSANYTPLLPTSLPWSGTAYDGDGIPGLPGGLGGYIFLALETDKSPHRVTGHPGPGLGNRFVIAAFTLSSGGQTWLSNTLVETIQVGNPISGVELLVYVNDSLVPGSQRILPYLSSASFDLSLGNLGAGDTIYVGVGPNGPGENDAFSLDFTIEQSAIPEPASLAIWGSFAGLGLIAARRRGRRKKGHH